MIRDRAFSVTTGVACVALAFGMAPADGADSRATVPAGAAAAATAPGAAPDSASAPPARTSLTPRAVPDSISHTMDSTLVQRLKAGGYIIWFRHSTTNWAERDTQESDFSNRATQRNLSEAGRAQAAELGKAIAALKIPIEKVLASPMWRCRDTAQLAFGAYDTTGTLFFKGPKFREARIKMLSTSPAPGKNVVYVGHQDPLLPIVPGLRRDQVKEGDALVIQPLGERKFRVIVQVSPTDWARLAGTHAPPAAEIDPADLILPPLSSGQPAAFDSLPPPRAINPRKVKK